MADDKKTKSQHIEDAYKIIGGASSGFFKDESGVRPFSTEERMIEYYDALRDRLLRENPGDAEKINRFIDSRKKLDFDNYNQSFGVPWQEENPYIRESHLATNFKRKDNKLDYMKRQRRLQGANKEYLNEIYDGVESPWMRMIEYLQKENK